MTMVSPAVDSVMLDSSRWIALYQSIVDYRPSSVEGEPAVTRYRRLPSRLPVTDASDPERQPVSYASDPEAAPVSYARDPERHLSPTPATPIGAVDGVGDRTGNLSMA